MHFTMALTVAAIFYMLTRCFPLPENFRESLPGDWFTEWRVSVNNLRLAIPLVVRSLSPHPILFKHRWDGQQAVIHLFCVGLPIALVVKSIREATVVVRCEK